METILSTLPGFGEMMNDISLGMIMKLYGMMCLVCLPFSLAAFVHIYRKRPDTVRKFDAAVDRLVDGKKDDTQKTEETIPEQDNVAAPDEKEKLSVEESNALNGISNMILKAGDMYRCFLSSKNAKDISSSDRTWGVSNRFVGEIDGARGIFRATRVGSTYIDCGSDHVSIYYATVKPNNTEWFGYEPLAFLLGRVQENCIASRKIMKNPSYRFNEETGTITYDIPEGKMTITVNAKTETVRFMLRLTDSETVRATIAKEMEEYMKRIEAKGDETEKKDIAYWFHKCGYDDLYPESVDLVAIMKKAHDGSLYFGAGECWRDGAREDEVTCNTDMVERSFMNLMDKEDIPETVGSRYATTARHKQRERPSAESQGKDSEKKPRKNTKRKDAASAVTEEPAEVNVAPVEPEETANSESADTGHGKKGGGRRKKKTEEKVQEAAPANPAEKENAQDETDDSMGEMESSTADPFNDYEESGLTDVDINPIEDIQED